MNAHSQAFADDTPLAARCALSEMAAFARRRTLLSDAWRGNLRSIEDHLFFIQQHKATIENASGQRLSQKQQRYVRYCRTRLADRLQRYLVCVRRVSECEAEMDSLGIPYAASSNAWEAA